MRELHFQTPDEMARAADAWCEAKAEEYEAGSLFLPAGNTPKPLYALWERERPPYLRNLRLTQLDEVLGEGEPGRFRKFFDAELPSYAPRIASPLKVRTPADLAVLGLGPNGHVAFHEPGLDPTFVHGEVPLSKDTCRRLGVAHPWKGMTFGLGAFLGCKAVLLIVSGKGKEDAWRAFQAGDLKFPAAHLSHHSDLTVLVAEDLLASAKEGKKS